MKLTADQLSRSMQCPLARATKWIDAINLAMDEFEINTPLRVAHFIAQLGHESGRLMYVREIASGDAYTTRADLGNTRAEAIAIAAAHGAQTGPWWKGHGPIQITGFSNHKACGEALGLDLLNNPRLLEEFVAGSRSSGWFWTTRNLNAFADKDDLEGITTRVNGRKMLGLENRRLILNTTKQVLGI